jgi:putative molybdopterin biosynthesis protein
MKKKIYLDSMPLDEALRLWNERLHSEGMDKPLLPETIKVAESLNRITAEAVSAKISSPFYHSAAMDGYAVRFSETFGAAETSPARLKIGAQAVYVDTGDPMPDGFDAVIMIEDVNIVSSNELQVTSKDKNSSLVTRHSSQDYVEIIEPATPWQHVRVIGEDIVATELIIPENHKIRPMDIGALLAGGHAEIMVRKKPRVAILPTGNELREPGFSLKKGDIIEYNSQVLCGLVLEWGGEPVRFDIVRDDPDELKRNIEKACNVADIVVVNAGSSAGSEDFTAAAVKELGDMIVHGIAIKPGKPVILGIVKGRPVLGIPGYPVSTYITFSLFAKPLVHNMQGIKQTGPDKIKAGLSRQIASTLGVEEFVRVKVGAVGDKTIATPVSRGAGVIMSLVRADGILRIPSMSEGFGAGSEVDVELIRQRDEIRNTIVCIGSHDNTLDLLSNFLKKRSPEFSLSSAHVGSMGGLIAIKRGEAHIAGMHLLDEETGEYNIPFIKKLIPEKKVVLVNLVYRQQGLLVKKGNPKNIRGFKDLKRGDIAFINRQAGSGTRLLTDKHLREMGIDPHSVNGYDRDEYTHMGVASAVLTGISDTGVAVLAAANALGLDFIPVAKERYDLVIPSDFIEMEMMASLLRIIREDEEFRETVKSLGGYDIDDMGKVIYEA